MGPGPRVLYVLPDLGVGGGQTILLRTAQAASAQAGTHLVVALRDGPMRTPFEQAGLETVVLGGPSPASLPGAVWRLLRLVRRRRIDVIVSFNTPLDRTAAQLVGLLTGVPVTIWFMSVAIALIPFPPPASRIPAFVKRLALFGPNYVTVRRAAALLSLSESVTRSFAAHLRLATDRFDLVPPGLPASFYDAPLDEAGLETLRAGLGLAPADGPVLLNVGMLIDLKGQQELVPAMAEVNRALPGATLLLVGDGPNRARLEAMVAELGLGERVRLLGHRQDVPALLQLADGLVSASRSEGFGMAVLEAMAASKPVVAVHTPAFDEFATDGVSAHFVAAQDRRLLAEGIKAVFADPVRAGELGVAARSAAEAFRAERTAALLLDVLARVGR
jgi:glycosyltransferase involved in cell wall biosynthesis